jgi:hypothetical protein
MQAQAAGHGEAAVKRGNVRTRGRTKPRSTQVGAMLTKDILFGMNILTLAGFAVMGLTLTLNRMGQAGKLLSIGLMGAGTALVFFGLYEGGWSR